MRLRNQYLIVGFSWALLLAPSAFLGLFSFAAGISWILLFGDEPWPQVTRWALPLIGIVGAILAAALCIFAANVYGQKREALQAEISRRERGAILVLGVTPMALILLVGLKVWKQGQDYADAMAVASQREINFSELLGARHRIVAVSVDRPNKDAFRAIVQLVGQRDGDYRLNWRIADAGFGKTLVSRNQVTRLQSGAHEIVLTFTLDDLARAYQAKLLTGGGVLVEEPFRLQVVLEPVLGDAKRLALPANEQHRLAMGISSLRSQKDTRFPVRFIIRRDGTLEK